MIRNFRAFSGNLIQLNLVPFVTISETSISLTLDIYNVYAIQPDFLSLVLYLFENYSGFHTGVALFYVDLFYVF